MATFTGNNFNNTFNDGSRSTADLYYLYAGNDYASVGGGNDTVVAGDGFDTVYGGDGSDYVNGGNDGDFLYGQNGDDTLYGGYGGDYLDGGAGNDLLFGEWGNDGLIGRAGNDNVSGGDGDDEIYGGLGNDTVFGGSGNDYIGDDYFGSGGGGFDSITGGAGADTFRLANWNGDGVIYAQSGDTDRAIIADWNSGGSNQQDKLQLPVSYFGTKFGLPITKFELENGLLKVMVFNPSVSSVSLAIYDRIATIRAAANSFLSGSSLMTNVINNVQWVSGPPY